MRCLADSGTEGSTEKAGRKPERVGQVLNCHLRIQPCLDQVIDEFEPTRRHPGSGRGLSGGSAQDTNRSFLERVDESFALQFLAAITRQDLAAQPLRRINRDLVDHVAETPRPGPQFDWLPLKGDLQILAAVLR